MLYLYALLASEPKDLPDATLETVRCGDIFAVVRQVAESPAVNETELRSHEKIVRKISQRVNAILPVRFGSVLPDPETLQKLITGREVEMRRALSVVEGREQMTLRVFEENGQPARSATAETAADDLGPGSRYLMRKMIEQTIPGLDTIRKELASLVKAELIQQHQKPPLLASIYHLIEKGQSAQYIATVDAIRESPVRLVPSGPWPPYAFGRWEE